MTAYSMDRYIGKPGSARRVVLGLVAATALLVSTPFMLYGWLSLMM